MEFRYKDQTISAKNGVTFTPHIEDGILSFTNDGSLPNPEPISLGGGGNVEGFVDGVLDIEHGGTGGSDATKAVAGLGYSLTKASVGETSDYVNVYVMTVWDSTTSYKTSISDLRKTIVGTGTQLSAAQTDYTTLRARAISLHQTMPSSDLINGAIYGIY